jgi:hypothetical protein
LHQFDNEGAFCGGHTHRRVIGRVVRLCLFCGVEAFFTPIYEAKRNHPIETFHSLWCQAFWTRQTFTDLAHVRAQTPVFTRWYHHHYRPPCLEGKTPAQMRYGVRVPKLTTELRRLIPDFQAERLPLTAGRFHFTTWKVSSFAGRQSLCLSGWHQHLQHFIAGFALGKIPLA